MRPTPSGYGIESSFCPVKNSGSTSMQLVPQVYRDVDKKLHQLAERSLLAHLLKLQKEGRAVEQGGGWHLSS